MGRIKGKPNRPGVITRQFTRERKEAYLEELARTGEIQRSCDFVGVSRGSLNAHRSKDEWLREQELVALERYRAVVHTEIHRRAIEGVDEPVYHGSQLVGYKRRYSDQLLLAHAKRHSPSEYGDRLKVDQTTRTEDHLGTELGKLSPESRELLRRILEIEQKAQEGR